MLANFLSVLRKIQSLRVSSANYNLLRGISLANAHDPHRERMAGQRPAALLPGRWRTAFGAAAAATAILDCFPRRCSRALSAMLVLIPQACRLDFFGWLIVSTTRGCAYQHLFHGLGLDKTFDSSVDHRVDTLVHSKFMVDDIRGVNLCGSV